MGRPKGTAETPGTRRRPLRPGTGLVLPANDGPLSGNSWNRRAKGWCYRCDSEHRWEEPCR